MSVKTTAFQLSIGRSRVEDWDASSVVKFELGLQIRVDIIPIHELLVQHAPAALDHVGFLERE